MLTLSTRLKKVDLTLECKLCAHLIVKKGVWFMTVSTFKRGGFENLDSGLSGFSA